ncbi:MAG: 5-formyltetrahydrofolate cyclo-ligase [Elainellaceae cyanobacterium]
MTDKKTLRRSHLQARQSMPLDLWRQKSDRLCDHVRRSQQFQSAQTVLAYSSFRREPDLSSLFELDGKTWGFPRCVGKVLSWHRWSPQDSVPLQPGAFDILEPHPDSPVLHSEQVDLILVPAVACDRQGYRLGYGGGFYDRMLSEPAWKNKRAIGIVFSESHVEKLPADAWDQRLQGVCTDSGWFDIPVDI